MAKQRQEAGKYRPVGECYVDVVMYDEVWNESKCSKIELFRDVLLILTGL